MTTRVFNIHILLLVIVFFGFGLFHLGKFETVDEHFWKYERIPRYWEGIKSGLTGDSWKKTYINDKPGVTVALVSGLGLLAEPHPETHRVRDDAVTENDALTVYDASRAEHINRSLRLPVLATGAISLPAFSWLIAFIIGTRERRRGTADSRASTRGRRIALLAVAFMATSPVLVGMSQILNPDALLWIFMPLALLSFWAYLETGLWRFVWMTGILTGLALLSKYTANLLFIFFVAAWLLHLVADGLPEPAAIARLLRDRIKAFLVIVATAVVTFACLMPAVLEKPKYLLRGTVDSPAMRPILIPLATLVTALALDAWIFGGRGTASLLFLLRRARRHLLTLAVLSFLLLLVGIAVNVESGGRFVPLDDLKEQSYEDGDLTFSFVSQDPTILQIAEKVIAESQSLPFSWTPVELLLLVIGSVFLLFRRPDRLAFPILLILTVWWIFIAGALVSGVLLTYRYSIVLYPLVALAAGLAAGQLVYWAHRRFRLPPRLAWEGMFLVIVGSGAYALWHVKPFYLNYTSSFLPKEYVLVDSWGYGEYEAAEYLNSLPDARSLIVWSDRSAFCQFFVGKCIRNYKIDLTKTVPDYFVFSRRGSIRSKFEWRTPDLAKRGNLDYYADDILAHPDWQISIGGRDKNFVKVIRTVEKD